MAALTTQNITIAAPKLDLVAALAAAAGGGDTAEITRGGFFVLNNGSGVTVTATFAVTETVEGKAVTNATMAVPAGKVGVMPLSRIFRDATGRAAVTYSAVTTVTVGVFRL
jgi:hypothetical protein